MSRALDFGAEGIIAPMINTQADARAFAAAAKFPPVGERSWGPHRATMLGGIAEQKDYLAQANGLTVTLAMTETGTALENLDAIATTPGIDGSSRSVRSFDCALAGPLARSAIEGGRGSSRPHHHGRSQGGQDRRRLLPHAERAVALAKRGVRFLAVSSDMAFLRAGAAAQLKVLKGKLPFLLPRDAALVTAPLSPCGKGRV